MVLPTEAQERFIYSALPAQLTAGMYPVKNPTHTAIDIAHSKIMMDACKATLGM